MSDTSGIVVYRASRLEALLDPFETLRRSGSAGDVLRPTRVVAAHPGIKRWMIGALARRAGPRGVVANLDVRLPSEWLDELAVAVLGGAAPSLAPYRRDALRWRILDSLARVEHAQLREYLARAAEPWQRLQFADRLAGLYAQYLVYRPDWLLGWQRGNLEHPQESLLGPLWRRLRDEIGQPHRAERMAQLFERLREAPTATVDAGVLHVFGVSHLPPAVLQALRLLARTRLVAIYMPDPCVQHWAGLRNQREVLTQFSNLGVDAEAERAYLDLGHPLLASLGRMGQHFGLVLNEGEDGVRSDTRHWADRAPQADDPQHLLGRVQDSIRQLKPSLVDPSTTLDADAARNSLLHDPSLRVHACHTRLREVEVLRDALLSALADDPTLEPRDIVVMAPDIGAYAPLLPAVLGAAGQHRGPLPYHVADVGLSRSHPVFEAFLALLELPTTRISAPAIVGLLTLAPVARALGLDAEGGDALARWLGRARVAWGLDAAARGGFDVPAIDDHTFAWGISRMLAGLVYGEDRDGSEVPLPDLLPVAGIHGPQVQAIGALDRLLGEIDALRRDAHAQRPAQEWFERLRRLASSLLRADPDDREESEALALLLRALDGVRIEIDDAGVDPTIDFATARGVLRERLDVLPGRAAYLPGGITFCGMVPQRAVPFRIIAVLGLDDGAFPRQRSDGGLDLMVRFPRLGDRDARSDDRYLFLETLMAARSRLHLSYVGEGAQDGRARNPAAPLTELLAFLDAQHPQFERTERHGADQDRQRTPPWLVRHPLQPFDRRYFDRSDPRLFTRERQLVASGGGVAAPFVAVERSIAADAEAALHVPLRSLLAYFTDPARQLLVDGLKLRLDAFDDHALADSEPLDAALSRIDGIERRLVLDALASDADEVPAAAPDWLRLSGILPSGLLGERSFAAAHDIANNLLQAARETPLFARGSPDVAPQVIDLEVGRYRVQGTLSRVFRAADDSLQVVMLAAKEGKQLGLREQVPLFLEWALLALADPDAQVAAALIATDGANPWAQSLRLDARSAADVQSQVQGLLDIWSAAQQQPEWYFPRTSSAALAAAGKSLDAVARAVGTAWAGQGDFGRGERDHAPGYAKLLAAGRAPDDPNTPEFARLCELAVQIGRLIGVHAAETPR
jgi:exodeoxyribonuclease V gamma subunit